jgi:hypothetical protein
MGLYSFLKNSTVRRIFSVAAGDPGQVDLLSSNDMHRVIFTDKCNNELEKQSADYIIFKVEGNSMAIENIHKGDYLLANELSLQEKTQIKKNDILIFKVDKVLFQKHYPEKTNPIDYKLRKFCDYINLSLTDDTILANVRSVIYEINQPKYKDIFLKKLARARNDFKDESLILLSVTYLNNSIDFSLHPIKDLFAKAEYLCNIKNSDNTLICDQATSISSTTAQRLFSAIKYLAENKIDRYISGVTTEFRDNVLKAILTTSQNKIRGAFAEFSDIFNNGQIGQIKNILSKGVSLEVVIYNELSQDNILFLRQNLFDYLHQIIIKASGIDKKFLKDGEAISFCIGDDSMYILRPNIEQSLVESNFKDNELCEKLTTLFDTNFISLETINLAN